MNEYLSERLPHGGHLVRKNGIPTFAASTSAECSQYAVDDGRKDDILAENARLKGCLIGTMVRAIYGNGSMDNRVLAEAVFNAISDQIVIRGTRPEV